MKKILIILPIFFLNSKINTAAKILSATEQKKESTKITAPIEQQIELLHAIDKQDITAVQKLLESGMDVNYKVPINVTTLMQESPVALAVFGFIVGNIDNIYGRADIVKLLLEAGANPNEKFYNGKSLLEAAFDSRNPNKKDLINILVDHGADVNTLTGFLKSVPILAKAVSTGDKEIVEIILRKKPNINDIRQRSAMSLAVQEGDKEIVKLLLDNGADINIANDASDLPLAIAVFNNDTEMINLLLKNGATVKREMINVLKKVIEQEKNTIDVSRGTSDKSEAEKSKEYASKIENLNKVREALKSMELNMTKAAVSAKVKEYLTPPGLSDIVAQYAVAPEDLSDEAQESEEE